MGKMKEHVADTLASIRHWKMDVECGLQPSMESLNDAERRILGLFRNDEFDAARVDFELRQSVRNARSIQMTRAQIMEIINSEMAQ